MAGSSREREAQRLGHDFTRQVVVGRARARR